MKGLYVHIPFCGVKCPYCSFTAFPGQHHMADRYLDALEKEMRAYRIFRPDTLYVGGGTPGCLSCRQIEKLFVAVSLNYGSVKLFKESTFEANPESLDKEKVIVLKNAGITRISLGMLCAQDRLLGFLGRRHTFADFQKVFSDLRKNGFGNINVDVMTAIPGQTMEDFRETVDAVLRIAPEHFSVYSLQVEEGTPFHKKGIKEDGEAAREMYEYAVEKLVSAGYRRYEISNFAKPGMECRHNLNYWDNGEYLGLGCSAASHIAGERKTDPSGLGGYMEPLLSGKIPEPVSAEKISGKEKLGETMMLGLRKTEGIMLTARMKRDFRKQLEKLEQEGLIELSAGRVCIKPENFYLANRVFREFIPPFD
ncbi:MAG: radical SAM family heme chaperone HemW [bacterium]